MKTEKYEIKYAKYYAITMQDNEKNEKKKKKKKKKLFVKALLKGSAVLVPFKWNDLPKIYPKKVFPIFFMNNQRKKKMKRSVNI